MNLPVFANGGSDMAATTHGASQRRNAGAFLDSWFFVRLVLLGLAVTATLTQFWPPLTLLWWLLATAGVVSVLLRRPGRDGIDWIARGLGVVISSVILLGVGLNAITIPLDSRTWALGFGAIGALILIASYVVDRQRDKQRDKQRALGVAQAGRDGSPDDSLVGQRSASQDMVNGWRSIVRRPVQAGWILVAALLVVSAVSIGWVTEPRLTPDLELSLSDPKAASTKATSVTVTVTAREQIDNLLLKVQPAGDPETAGQRFSIEAGQSVERTISLPATGASQVILTSPGKPDLARTLTINR